jgi:hypothetical protein
MIAKILSKIWFMSYKWKARWMDGLKGCLNGWKDVRLGRWLVR